MQHTQRATPNTRTKSKEKEKRGNMDSKQLENVTYGTCIYIQIGKQKGYRLGTVSGKCHWGFKPPGLRATNLIFVLYYPIGRNSVNKRIPACSFYNFSISNTSFKVKPIRPDLSGKSRKFFKQWGTITSYLLPPLADKLWGIPILNLVLSFGLLCFYRGVLGRCCGHKNAQILSKSNLQYETKSQNPKKMLCRMD